MASIKDIVLAILVSLIFAGVVYVAYILRSAITGAVESKKEKMEAKGFTYKDGKIDYKSKKQLTQDEYIAKQRDAILRGRKLMKKPGASGFNQAQSDAGVSQQTEIPEWAK